MKLCALLSCLLAASCATAVKRSPALESLADGFDEGVAIAVLDLADDSISGVRLDRPMPQLSVFKTWVAAAAADMVAQRKLAWDEKLTVSDAELKYEQPQIVATIAAQGHELTVETLVTLMVTVSDNAATDVLLRRMGGPEVVRAFLISRGIGNIGVKADEAGLHARGDAVDAAIAAAPSEQRVAIAQRMLAEDPNRATARGIADGLARLYRGKLLDAAQTAKVLTILEATTSGPNRLRAGTPADYRLMHKTGTGGDSDGILMGTNDVGIIVAPDGHAYAVVVLVAGVRRSNDDAEKLAADVARHVTRP